VVKLNDKTFISAMILTMLSSILSGAFFIIALKSLDVSNGLMFFTLVSLFELAMLLGYMVIRNKKIAFPKKKYIANSISYSVATILFLLLMNESNIITLSEIFTINIIIFIFFQISKHKDIINRKIIFKLFVGGVFVVLALLFAYGFNNVSLSPIVIIIAIIITFLYGLSNYLFSHNSKHSYTKTNFMFWLIVFQLLISSTATAVFDFSTPLDWTLVGYSLIGSISLFLSTIIMIYSYHNIKDYAPVSRLIGTSVLFVLSETDVVFISLFYEIFINALNTYMVISVVLIVIAIYIISSIEERIKVAV
jgi:drug/metabolite transporter (DMT)-like permease